MPTPLVWKGKLIVSTEGNGTRLFAFRNDGTTIEEPVAESQRLSPDMRSAVIVGERLYCVNQLAYCLQLDNELKPAWRKRDSALAD